VITNLIGGVRFDWAPSFSFATEVSKADWRLFAGADLDRVHFSWNHERDLFSFILSMFFMPNRVHFG